MIVSVVDKKSAGLALVFYFKPIGMMENLTFFYLATFLRSQVLLRYCRHVCCTWVAAISFSRLYIDLWWPADSGTKFVRKRVAQCNYSVAFSVVNNDTLMLVLHKNE